MVLFCMIMSAISTTLLSVFGGIVDQWYDFWIVLLLLVGFYFAWCLLIVVFAFLVTLPINRKKSVNKPSKFYKWLFNLVNGWLIDMAGVKLHVIGKEKLNKNTRYLVVSNHRSNFDSQIIARVFKHNNILLISKPQNFKIPIAGPCIHKMGYMAIDRENDRKAIETIIKASNYLKNGYSIGLMPEGTRNKESLDLLPFKNGVFKVAQRAHAPIVIAVFNGTEKIHKNFPFKRTHVYLDILEVMSAQTALDMSTVEIGDHAMEIMQAKIDEYKQK